MIQDLAQEILAAAQKREVYDFYILPNPTGSALYFRNAQARFLQQTLTEEDSQALISHFKFVAGMNVGERRRTQLGACWYEVKGQALRLRLSTVGDFIGRESLVVRLLHDKAQELAFWQAENWSNKIKGRGLYLFAGPVGSGKTTLMYELAKQHFAEQQVITIEDPVELVEPRFLQLQLNEVIANDYDELIKLSLRHRPDLLIVGEIRDVKTAKAVLRASLTGYTVFSTLHAKSVAGVYARLRELGLSAWEIQQSLQAICYQRLIAGKGLLEWAEGNFENYSAEKWNEKIEKLAAAGHLKPAAAQAEKIRLS